MGKRGPSAKSSKLRKLEGNPANRPLNENQPVPVGVAQPPGHLCSEAKKMWFLVLGSMPSDFYASADVGILTAYCQAWALHGRAMRILAKQPYVTVSDKGNEYLSPWMGILNTQARLMVTFGDRLGLSPAARERLTHAGSPSQKPKGKFDGLLGRSDQTGSSSSLNS